MPYGMLNLKKPGSDADTYSVAFLRVASRQVW